MGYYQPMVRGGNIHDYLESAASHHPLIIPELHNMFTEIMETDPGYELEQIRWKEAGGYHGVRYYRLQIFGEEGDWNHECKVYNIIDEHYPKIIAIMNKHYAEDNQVYY